MIYWEVSSNIDDNNNNKKSIKIIDFYFPNQWSHCVDFEFTLCFILSSLFGVFGIVEQEWFETLSVILSMNRLFMPIAGKRLAQKPKRDDVSFWN